MCDVTLPQFRSRIYLATISSMSIRLRMRKISRRAVVPFMVHDFCQPYLPQDRPLPRNAPSLTNPPCLCSFSTLHGERARRRGTAFQVQASPAVSHPPISPISSHIRDFIGISLPRANRQSRGSKQVNDMNGISRVCHASTNCV